MTMILHRWNVKVLFFHPAVYLHLLCQNIITLNVFLVLTPPPRAMKPLQFSPFTSTSTSWDRRRRWDGGRERLRVQPVHNQFFHSFLGVVEFVVRHISPNFAYGHLVRNEYQKITDNLDLFMNHPLSFSKLVEEGAQELGNRVRSAMAQLFQKPMKVESFLRLRGWRRRRSR